MSGIAIAIYCCYAHKDQTLLNELKLHLVPLQRYGLITVWNDTDISPGSEWEAEIYVYLNTAQVILLLVSPDFMASDYCYSKEMKRAMERHASGEARVIPVILRHVYWQGAPFGKLQALPTGAKPLKSWHDQDKAFFNVVEGIRKVVEDMRTYTAQPIKEQRVVNPHLREMSDQERQRRSFILTKIRKLYVLSSEGMSAGIMAGTEPLPKEWVEKQLEKMGETWRQDIYY